MRIIFRGIRGGNLSKLGSWGYKKRLFDWFNSDNVFIEPAAAAESKVCSSQTKFPHDSSTSHLFPLYVCKCIENPIHSHFGSGVTWLPGGFKKTFTLLVVVVMWSCLLLLFFHAVAHDFCLQFYVLFVLNAVSHMLFEQLPGNDSNGGKMFVLFI